MELKQPDATQNPRYFEKRNTSLESLITEQNKNDAHKLSYVAVVPPVVNPGATLEVPGSPSSDMIPSEGHGYEKPPVG